VALALQHVLSVFLLVRSQHGIQVALVNRIFSIYDRF